MKSVTYEEVKSWRPCWLETRSGARKLERIGRRKERWTALDVLNLPPEEVSSEDKLWVVLRPELVEESTLHEFACRCAEEALKLIENPDPRSIAAIEAKRRWLRGEISDSELDAAWEAARDVRAAAWDAASAAASAAAREAARAAAWAAASAAARAARDAASAAASAAAWDARDAAWDASDAAWDASDAASDAAWDASDAASAAASAAAWAASDAAWAAAWDAVWDAARDKQIDLLRELLCA